MQTIVIVNMDSGNLHSVAKAVQTVAGKVNIVVSNQLSDIQKADKLIVPGQGAINTWMKTYHHLNDNDGFLKALNSKPVFAICVGMQAMLTSAEEGAINNDAVKCLGFFQGHVARFHDEKLTIPQMGWNQVKQKEHSSHAAIWQGVEDNAWFYFAHSYHASECLDSETLGITEYGLSYPSVIAKDNILAVQFHPEKSQNNGLKIIENFINWKI